MTQTIEQFVAEIRERVAKYRVQTNAIPVPDWADGEFAAYGDITLPRAAEIIEGLHGINKYLMDQLLNVRVRADTSRIGATRWLADILTGEQATTNREQEGALKSDE